MKAFAEGFQIVLLSKGAQDAVIATQATISSKSSSSLPFRYWSKVIEKGNVFEEGTRNWFCGCRMHYRGWKWLSERYSSFGLGVSFFFFGCHWYFCHWEGSKRLWRDERELLRENSATLKSGKDSRSKNINDACFSSPANILDDHISGVPGKISFQLENDWFALKPPARQKTFDIPKFRVSQIS